MWIVARDTIKYTDCYRRNDYENFNKFSKNRVLTIYEYLL